jgi:hypothetical protein
MRGYKQTLLRRSGGARWDSGLPAPVLAAGGSTGRYTVGYPVLRNRPGPINTRGYSRVGALARYATEPEQSYPPEYCMSRKPALTDGPAVVPSAYFPCTSRHECIHAMVFEMRRLHANHSSSDDGSSRFYRRHSRRVECCNAGKVVTAGVESGRCRMDTVYGRCNCSLRIVEETAHPGLAARGYGHSARLSFYSTCSLQLICRTIVICTLYSWVGH